MAGRLKSFVGQAYEAWNDTNQIDKWYALPPKTPAKVVNAYRKAFAKAFKDPEFLKFGRHQFSADLTRKPVRN